MKKVRSGLFVLFCVTLFLGSVFGQKRAITEKDLFQFHWIGNPQLSPDGAQVAFVSIAVDEKREDYESSLWRVSVNGGEPRRLTAANVILHHNGRRMENFSPLCARPRKTASLSRRKYSSCL